MRSLNFLSRRVLGLIALTTVGPVAPSQAQDDYFFSFTGSFNPADGNTQLVLNGGALTLNTSDRGWYDDDGFTFSSNDNYLVGTSQGSTYHNFFLFDLHSVSFTVTSASLRLFNPTGQPGHQGGNFVSSPVLTYTNWDFTGNHIQQLILGFLDITAYNDLGSGIPYASTPVTAADNGTFVNIALNGSAVADINAAQSTLNRFWAVGGTLGPNLVSAPEPRSWALLAAGLGGLGVRTVRKRRTDRGQWRCG